MDVIKAFTGILRREEMEISTEMARGQAQLDAAENTYMKRMNYTNATTSVPVKPHATREEPEHLRLSISKVENGFILRSASHIGQEWKSYVVTDAAELTGMLARIIIENTLDKEST